MDRGAWWATVHGVAETSQTWLSNWTIVHLSRWFEKRLQWSETGRKENERASITWESWQTKSCHCTHHANVHVSWLFPTFPLAAAAPLPPGHHHILQPSAPLQVLGCMLHLYHLISSSKQTCNTLYACRHRGLERSLCPRHQPPGTQGRRGA